MCREYMVPHATPTFTSEYRYVDYIKVPSHVVSYMEPIILPNVPLKCGV